MKPLFIQNPIAVNNELEDLGLDRENLLTAVDLVVTARNNCTENDARSARGTQSYLTGTRVLRDIFCRKGWEKCDEGGMECIYHPKLQLKVMMVNTNDATGLNEDGKQPQNRNKKGPQTDQAVSMNQLCFWPDVEAVEKVIHLNQQPGGIQHWFFMVYAEGDVVRAELSYPESVKGGFFTTFRKRIILVGDDSEGDNGPAKRRLDGPDSGEDFEIRVTRKQA